MVRGYSEFSVIRGGQSMNLLMAKAYEHDDLRGTSYNTSNGPVDSSRDMGYGHRHVRGFKGDIL